MRAEDVESWRSQVGAAAKGSMSGLALGRWLRGALVALPTTLGDLARSVSLTGIWPGAGSQGLLPLPCDLLEAVGRARGKEKGFDPGN